jgi:hypothetical protein
VKRPPFLRVRPSDQAVLTFSAFIGGALVTAKLTAFPSLSWWFVLWPLYWVPVAVAAITVVLAAALVVDFLYVSAKMFARGLKDRMSGKKA